MLLYKHTCTQAHIHTHIYTHTHTYSTHRHTHTDTHTHTHTPISLVRDSLSGGSLSICRSCPKHSHTVSSASQLYCRLPAFSDRLPSARLRAASDCALYRHTSADVRVNAWRARYVCMYVWMYVCMYVCMDVYMYVCMYV
jgi:hypothetical protein